MFLRNPACSNSFPSISGQGWCDAPSSDSHYTHESSFCSALPPTIDDLWIQEIEWHQSQFRLERASG